MAPCCNGMTLPFAATWRANGRGSPSSVRVRRITTGLLGLGIYGLYNEGFGLQGLSAFAFRA